MKRGIGMEEKIYLILSQIRSEFNFRESNNFVEDGYLDSFDIVTLVSEIENQFDVMIDGMDIIPENFENVEAICTLINKSEK